MPLKKVGIAGTGSYAPEDVITNADLEKMVDTSDEWITTRTGTRERRRARADQATSDLAAEASIRALDDAGVSPDQVDAIICATVTPDMNFPSTACFIQKKLKALNAYAYDVSAACSGFLFALLNGRSIITAGDADTVLVVAAECMTKYTNYEDRTSCILFGDAAGAVVLRPTDGPHEITDIFAKSDGYSEAAMSMIFRNGGSESPFTPEALENKEQFMVIKGREVYRFAVTTFHDLVRDAAEREGVGVDDIDWIIPHQANLRILHGAAERLGYPKEKVYINLDKYGNSSAASIPLALDEAVRDGSIQDGQLIVLAAFGGGLTWASSTIRW